MRHGGASPESPIPIPDSAPVPIDLIVLTPERAAELRAGRERFARVIDEEGMVLYP